MEIILVTRFIRSVVRFSYRRLLQSADQLEIHAGKIFISRHSCSAVDFVTLSLARSAAANRSTVSIRSPL